MDLLCIGIDWQTNDSLGRRGEEGGEERGGQGVRVMSLGLAEKECVRACESVCVWGDADLVKVKEIMSEF